MSRDKPFSICQSESLSQRVSLDGKIKYFFEILFSLNALVVLFVDLHVEHPLTRCTEREFFHLLIVTFHFEPQQVSLLDLRPVCPQLLQVRFRFLQVSLDSSFTNIRGWFGRVHHV